MTKFSSSKDADRKMNFGSSGIQTLLLLFRLPCQLNLVGPENEFKPSFEISFSKYLKCRYQVINQLTTKTRCLLTCMWTSRSRTSLQYSSSTSRTSGSPVLKTIDIKLRATRKNAEREVLLPFSTHSPDSSSLS